MGYWKSTQRRILRASARAIEGDEDFKCFRNRENLEENCGTCSYSYICGGCKARAFNYFNNPSAPDIGCIYNRNVWKEEFGRITTSVPTRAQLKVPI